MISIFIRNIPNNGWKIKDETSNEKHTASVFMLGYSQLRVTRRWETRTKQVSLMNDGAMKWKSPSSSMISGLRGLPIAVSNTNKMLTCSFFKKIHMLTIKDLGLMPSVLRDETLGKMYERNANVRLMQFHFCESISLICRRNLTLNFTEI